MVEQSLGFVAVRIEQRQATSLFQILHGHVVHQGCFAGASFSEHVEMAPQIDAR